MGNSLNSTGFFFFFSISTLTQIYTYAHNLNVSPALGVLGLDSLGSKLCLLPALLLVRI